MMEEYENDVRAGGGGDSQRPVPRFLYKRYTLDNHNCCAQELVTAFQKLSKRNWVMRQKSSLQNVIPARGLRWHLAQHTGTWLNLIRNYPDRNSEGSWTSLRPRHGTAGRMVQAGGCRTIGNC
jgi:hypothetical protein